MRHMDEKLGLEYEITPDGVMVLSYNGADGCIVIPDKIEGIPVTAVASYAFAKADGSNGIKAEDVTEVRLPVYLKEIGRYAFYRCRNMKKFIFHGGLPAVGGGALTGCRFQEVEIYLHGDEKSALKSVLDEIRFGIHVRFHYCREDGTTESESEIFFPEHYEEAVENTPARILYTSHHGAGGYYRQCFYDRELDYKKYDELLPWAIAEETEETVVKLALLRLVFPHKLSREREEAYAAYVKAHMEAAVKLLIAAEDREKLAFLAKEDYWTEESLDYAIACAGRLEKTDILSILMDERYRRYPRKRKSFAL